MGKRIAVQNQLFNVKKYLKIKGYDVLEIEDKELLNSKNLDQYDAVVISGINKDMLGIEDTSTKAPVIDATGMTPAEVENNLKRL
ncbi:MAG: YkuS family protein [Minisyncoccia bacterium]